MPTMKGLTISSPGAPPSISCSIPIPEPGEGQILVKTSYAAINPIDDSMASSGFLVQSYPFTPGCDASGCVVATSPNATSALGTPWAIGDKVFGCTRLGAQGFAAWAEYLLFDAALCIPVPPNLEIDMAAAAGTGVALFTASLGVFDGLGVDLEKGKMQGEDEEWALVFGGAGSVGQFAVQLLRVAGFNVVATASARSVDLVKSLGAHAVLDYHKSDGEIIEELKAVTNGALQYAFDATSNNNGLLASVFAALASTTAGARRYTTTNDWDAVPLSTEESAFSVNPIQLGPIGHPDAVQLNEKLKNIIPIVYEMLAKGVIKPSEYVVEGKGLEDMVKAWDVQKSGTNGSKKVVVKIGDERV